MVAITEQYLTTDAEKKGMKEAAVVNICSVTSADGRMKCQF